MSIVSMLDRDKPIPPDSRPVDVARLKRAIDLLYRILIEQVNIEQIGTSSLNKREGAVMKALQFMKGRHEEEYRDLASNRARPGYSKQIHDLVCGHRDKATLVSYLVRWNSPPERAAFIELCVRNAPDPSH